MKKIHDKMLNLAKPKNLSKLSALLLKEEYKSERIVSIIRLVMVAMFIIPNLVKALIFSYALWSFLWPNFLAFLAAVFIYIEVLYWGKERYYNYYNRYVKYMYAASDVIVMSLVIIQTARMQGNISVLNLTIMDMVPLIFLLVGSLFVVINIIRFSPAAAFYSGALLIVSFFVSGLLGGIYPDFTSFFYYAGKANIVTNFFLVGIISLSVLSAYIANRFKMILTKSKRQEDLERFLPETIANQILQGETDLGISLVGKKQKATILFSDIRDFTTLSEQEKPEEVVTLLNSYFNDMINIVFKYNGTLDKIIGDGIMAIYGAPVLSDDAPLKAVQSALDMQRKLEDFNQIRSIQGKSPIRIGIGIHTGDVIMGNIGSEKRMEYTAIGDTVNTASRLETYTKVAGAKIIISEATRKYLNGEFSLKNIGAISLKGKKEKIEAYEVGVKEPMDSSSEQN